MRAMRFVRVALLLLAVFAVLGVGGWLYIQDAFRQPVAPASEEKVIFEVDKGATLSAVGEALAHRGLIGDPRIWKVYLKLHPKAPTPKAGRHEVSPSMNIPELLEALAGKPLSEDVPLTMVEGWRLRDADAALADKGLVGPGAYLAATQDPSRFEIPFELPKGTKSLEGYLLPETYMVPKGKLDVEKLVQRQLDAFHERFVKPNADEIAKSKRSLSDLVKLASMLEREEPKPALRPKVAGVLYNRIDAGDPLGVDATSRYTLDEWNDRRAFLKKLRDPTDPYNTRLKAGLPPTPIGAPSLPSLLAALRPEPSKYWYYLHDADQNIHFAKTAAEHEANRKRYNVW